MRSATTLLPSPKTSLATPKTHSTAALHCLQQITRGAGRSWVADLPSRCRCWWRRRYPHTIPRCSPPPPRSLARSPGVASRGSRAARYTGTGATGRLGFPRAGASSGRCAMWSTARWCCISRCAPAATAPPRVSAGGQDRHGVRPGRPSDARGGLLTSGATRLGQHSVLPFARVRQGDGPHHGDGHDPHTHCRCYGLNLYISPIAAKRRRRRRPTTRPAGRRCGGVSAAGLRTAAAPSPSPSAAAARPSGAGPADSASAMARPPRAPRAPFPWDPTDLMDASYSLGRPAHGILGPMDPMSMHLQE